MAVAAAAAVLALSSSPASADPATTAGAAVPAGYSAPLCPGFQPVPGIVTPCGGPWPWNDQV